MPDWKDPEAYEKTLTRAGWAWEFMRRNAAYRQDFFQVATAWKNAPREGPFYVGDAAFEAERLGRELGAKWGQLGSIADPASDAVPTFFLAGPIEPDGEQVDAFYREGVGSGPALQVQEFATLTFDLRRPLRPQLARAGSMLRKRKKGVAALKSVRSSASQWKTYLQLLDAKESGAKTPEIVLKIDPYRGLGKKDKHAASDRVFDHCKRALQLRENPLTLLL